MDGDIVGDYPSWKARASGNTAVAVTPFWPGRLPSQDRGRKLMFPLRESGAGVRGPQAGRELRGE